MKSRTLAAGMIAAMLLTGAADCEKREDGKKPSADKPAAKDTRYTCPGVVWQDPEERCFTLQTFVESRLGPYEIDLHIDALEGAKEAAYPPHIPVSGGGWSHGAKYRHGKKYHIKLQVTYYGKDPSGDGFCSITDGGEPIKDKFRSLRSKGGSPYQCLVELAATGQ